MSLSGAIPNAPSYRIALLVHPKVRYLLRINAIVIIVLLQGIEVFTRLFGLSCQCLNPPMQDAHRGGCRHTNGKVEHYGCRNS
jgi:hypothetical protein